MVDLTLWFSFVGTVLLLVLTPGPSVLLATANSMKYGTRKTMGTIFGDLSANLLQIILASLGLASIVIASGELFQAIKWIGVIYLVILGLKKMILAPKMEWKNDREKHRSFKGLFAEGFLMSAANPKAIVFFAAFFPLFIDGALPFLPQVLILALTFLLLDGMALSVYSLFATRLKNYLESSKKVHLQNKIVGVLLILSGVMLSMVRRSNS